MSLKKKIKTVITALGIGASVLTGCANLENYSRPNPLRIYEEPKVSVNEQHGEVYNMNINDQYKMIKKIANIVQECEERKSYDHINDNLLKVLNDADEIIMG